jgi:flagellar biosynthesis GTPase FlhF
MEKSTVNSTPEKIELFQALTKSTNGKYLAVLSDTSIDRDGEIVSAEALEGVIKSDGGQTAILLNHENNIENLIGHWTNKRLVDIDGHKSLVAEPEFFLSNPKAQMIKGMLDEGAQCGISIGAMVTELELLEASFVAIPSNRHGMAMMAMAKKFGKKLDEETQMAEETTKTYSEEEFSAVLAEKSVAEERIVQLEKDLEEAKAEPEVAEEAVAEEAEAEPEAEEEAKAEPEAEEAKEASVESDISKELSDLKEANKALTKEFDDFKASPLYKSQFNTPEGDTEVEAPELSQLDKGLPIINR